MTGKDAADQHITLTNRFIQEQEHEFWPDKPFSEFDHRDCRVCGPGPLRRGQIPSQWPHVFYREKLIDTGYRSVRAQIPTTPEQATLVASNIAGEPGWHTVMLDIDMPCRVVASSTPGHFHLYIDAKLRWGRYRLLLWVLQRCGIIERGYYKASVGRRATHLRPPWVDKNRA